MGDIDEPSSCRVTRDSTWRRSTHHVDIECERGQCYLDFRLREDETWIVNACSFDGAGCMGTVLHNVPIALTDLLFQGLEEGQSRYLHGNQGLEAFRSLRSFFTQLKDDIPPIWHETFRAYSLMEDDEDV